MFGLYIDVICVIYVTYKLKYRGFHAFITRFHTGNLFFQCGHFLVVTYFQEDIIKQKLEFPNLNDPQKIVYEYKGDLEITFNKTMKYLQEFTYGRYTPLLFYIGNKRLTEFEKQQQRNVGGFMKGILVKRLESSFYAFRQSVERFILSYTNFINMYNDGTVYISKKANVYDLLDNDDFDKLESLVDEARGN